MSESSTVQFLESYFQKHGVPTSEAVLQELATKCKTSPDMISQWFIRRRLKSASATETPSAIQDVITGRAQPIPLLAVSMGTFQMTSKFVGDLCIEVDIQTQNLVWMRLNHGIFQKTVMSFRSLCGIDIKPASATTIELSLKISSFPQFFEEVNPSPHAASSWKVIGDFSGSQISPLNLQKFYGSKGAISQLSQILRYINENAAELAKLKKP